MEVLEHFGPENYAWRLDIVKQGFIQAIMISGTLHKKLNLLIEFWNSIFIKNFFKAYENRLASKLIQNYEFAIFIYPPDVKRP